MDDELRGVKGWLLTFVIIMAVVSPAWSIIQVYRELYSEQAPSLPDIPMVVQMKTFVWTMVAVDAAIGWFAAWRLVAVHNWRSVQIAIACIWIGSLGLRIVEYIGTSAITGLSFGDLLGSTGVKPLVQALGFGLIWTAYLLKSERVANTYRGGPEQAAVFE